jgi:hypothetical protein
VVISRDGSLADATVSGNHADGAGGGVYVDEDDFTVTGVDLVDNTSQTGAGLFVEEGVGTLDTVTFTDNLATNGDGGLELHQGAEGPDFSCTAMSLTCTW